MNSKTKACILGFGLLIAIAIAGAGIWKPQRTYEVEDDRLPFQLGNGYSPLQAAETLLQQTVYLPPDLPYCFNVEPPNLAGMFPTPTPARQITEIKFTAVHLSSLASLLFSVLDDDPIVQAVVDGLVMTADGRPTPFTATAWDYGLLTPSAIHLKGDGWKLSKVCYG